MNVYKLLALLVFLHLHTQLPAQDDIPLTDADEQIAKLDATTRRMTSYLQSLECYQVEVSQAWELKGLDERRGTNELKLIARHDGRFQFEEHLKGEQQGLVCVSDGNVITRIMERNGRQLYSQQPGALNELLDDAMTESSVRFSGLDVLCRDDAHRYIMGMSSSIKFLGEEQLPGGLAQHFRMLWGDGQSHVLDLWISTGTVPLLAKLECKIDFVAEEEKKQTMKIVSTFDWKPHTNASDDVFQAQLSKGAQKVTDLYGYLSEGGTMDLAGQEAPSVGLPLLGGGNWEMASHREKAAVVIYFYSTWAAPSREQIPELLKFVESYEQRGVIFYAVDVGEDAETAEAFVKSQQYTHPVVVDSESKAAAAYRVTSLPTVVIVDQDGKISSAHVGNTPEVRAMVREELDQLLGKD